MLFTMEERTNSEVDVDVRQTFQMDTGKKKLLTRSEGHNAHSIALSSQTAESKRIRRLNGNYRKRADCMLTPAGFGLV